MPEPAPASPSVIPLVDLTGLGLLSCTFDKQAFEAFGRALEHSPADIEVTIDAAGSIVECAVSIRTPADAAKAGQLLCDQISLTGQNHAPPWYSTEMTGGRIELRIEAEKGFVPQRPVRFGDAPQGKSAYLSVWLDQCDVARSAMSAQDMDAVCAAYILADRPGAKGNHETKSAKLRLAVVPGVEPYQITAGERISDRGKAVDFGVVLPRAEIGLTANDGHGTMPIDPFDYPRTALQHGVKGGVLVMAGYDRMGIVRTCRPLQSANSSYLANASCSEVVAKTHFEFVPGALMFDGLRYRILPITWVIPRD